MVRIELSCVRIEPVTARSVKPTVRLKSMRGLTMHSPFSTRRLLPTQALRLVAAVSLATLSACGGGGGSGDNGGGGSGGLSNNACAAAGLNAKIIDGTECDDTRSPIVKINLFASNGSRFLCSGTVVQARSVLTAGHCFLSESNETIEGASVIVDGQERFASVVYLHPEYRVGDTAIFNDVAVLEFAQPLNLPPLPVILSRKVVADDTFAILGYGSDERGEFGVLRSGEMAASSVSPNHIFSVFGSSGSNTCNGDSGGPALLTFTDDSGQEITGIVGVTSTGTAGLDCQTGDLSLFANVQEEPIVSFLRRRAPGLTFR